MLTSLSKRKHPLAVLDHQRHAIEAGDVERFENRLKTIGLSPLHATSIQTFQINLGKMCNQVCNHCHVDAGPDRKEIMTRETMQLCLDAIAKTDAPIADLTGGAPEMNPDFRWFVDRLLALGRHIIDRSNLTILVTGGFKDLPEFLAERRVEITASLPYYLQSQTDAQRGDHVFKQSIDALGRLNALGYGKPGSGLILNLVYNPIGAILPPKQCALEAEFKRELQNRYGIVFNALFAVTNLPINRFLEFLIDNGHYDAYMAKLAAAFNDDAARNVMCRSMISISWDGRLYDCDFNQMLDMTVASGLPDHIRDFDAVSLAQRRICNGNHCYGCTAGAGSSCTGSVVK